VDCPILKPYTGRTVDRSVAEGKHEKESPVLGLLWFLLRDMSCQPALLQATLRADKHYTLHAIVSSNPGDGTSIRSVKF
jgi:hypothetical protein